MMLGLSSNIGGLIEGVALLIAFYGFGHLILKWAGLERGFRLGLSAAVGMSAFILAGGFVNLMAAVNRPVIGTTIAAGILLAVWSMRTQKPSIGRHPAWAIVGALLIGWILTHAATVSFYSDDLEGYLFFFEKFAQTGSLGADPFSGKRLYSNIGGHYFVQAALLQFGTIAQMHLFDAGLCTVITVLMIVEYLAARRVSPWLCVGVASLAFVVDVVFPTTNTASGALRTGLLAMMILVADDEADMFSFGRAIVMAILAGACIALKGQMLAAVPAVMGGLFLFQAATNRAAWIGLFGRYAVAGGLALALNAPYMFAHYASSGTPLYPVFGAGFYSAAFSTLAKNSFAEAMHDVFVNLVRSRRMLSAAALFALLLLVMRKIAVFRTREFAISAVMLAVLIAVAILLGYSLARMGWVVTRDMERYAAPLIGAGFLFSAMATVAIDARLCSRGSAVIATLACLLVVQATTRDTLNHARQMVINLVYLVTGDATAADALMQRIGDVAGTTVGDDTRREYFRKFQQQAKPGEGILALVPRAYLLDFKRNPLFLMECTGSVSPPPGIPLTEGAAALSAYWRQFGIRYILFEHRLGKPYADGPAVPEINDEAAAGFIANFDETVSRYDRVCHLNSRRFQRILAEMVAKNGTIFDDGQILMLDLVSR